MIQKKVSLVLFLILGSVFSGCSDKAPSPHKPAGKKQEARTYSKATQRPYVINGITYYPIPRLKDFANRDMPLGTGANFTAGRLPTVKHTTCTVKPPPTRPCPWERFYW